MTRTHKGRCAQGVGRTHQFYKGGLCMGNGQQGEGDVPLPHEYP